VLGAEVLQQWGLVAPREQMRIGHVKGAGGSGEGRGWAANAEKQAVAGAERLRAVGAVVAGAGALDGAGVGDGAPVATRGCMGAVWRTRGHPTRGQTVNGAVAWEGALAASGVDSGAPVATRGRLGSAGRAKGSSLGGFGGLGVRLLVCGTEVVLGRPALQISGGVVVRWRPLQAAC
jgi:hypothetical protein